MSAPRLIVSVDQVAAMRAANRSPEPDPVHYAIQAELAGALGIRAHLRIDRRDLSERDVELLNSMVKTQFFLQISPHQDVVHLLNGLRPHNAVLSAERRDEHALEHGLDASLLNRELDGIIKNVDTRQTRIFLFVEADLDQVKTAARLGVHGLVLNVRDLMVDARSEAHRKKLTVLRDAVRLAVKYKLETHLAGGVLAELLPELTQIPGVSAIHADHQLAARSLITGVADAVAAYLRLLQYPHRPSAG
ncbi:MAG: pyridoxine 5'-phosphate synthase [Acidobacteriota bacterium]|nr:pyridoxine 5'-phosphate synthase [Acidobacteriota bacterium]